MKLRQEKLVGILDSGVGGLTIFKEVRETCPQLSLVYLCDNKNLPYGPKTESQVLNCVDEVMHKVCHQFNLQALVVACNTMSTLALPRLREQLPIPVVGVVPAIKPAAGISKTKKIGLLATPGTIARPYTQTLIEDFASDCEVIKLGSSRLVELAEQKLRGISPSLEAIQAEIAPLFSAREKNIDTIVLGCTHFPLLLEELKLAAPKNIQWIDSIQAIGNRAKAISHDLETQISPSYSAAFTVTDSSLEALKPALKKLGISEIFCL